MARSMAIAAVAPGGSFAVGSALVLDELEHHRAGIGCMLESAGGGVVISVVVPGFVLLRASPAPRADSGRLCPAPGRAASLVAGGRSVTLFSRRGAAAAAGMHEGDVIEQIDDHVVTLDTGKPAASVSPRYLGCRGCVPPIPRRTALTCQPHCAPQA